VAHNNRESSGREAVLCRSSWTATTIGLLHSRKSPSELPGEIITKDYKSAVWRRLPRTQENVSAVYRGETRSHSSYAVISDGLRTPDLHVR
jgi:hypothetical protein